MHHDSTDGAPTGPDPLRAMELLCSLSLYQATFSLPPMIPLSKPVASYSVALSATYLLHLLLTSANSALPPVHHALLSTLNPDVKSRLFFAAALTPFRGITCIDSKKKSHPAVEVVIREGLKIGTQNHYLDGVPLLYASADLLRNPDLGLDQFKSPSERVAIGRLS